MIEDGLWLDRKQRRKQVHQPRQRRECIGELVQVNGSEHWWFEDRGPQCTLLVFVNDATSRLLHLEFVESELTFAYFHAARAYLEAWGKPIAFYSDKHGVFRVNHPGALGGDGMTQFGRALHALNIDDAPITDHMVDAACTLNRSATASACCLAARQARAEPSATSRPACLTNHCHPPPTYSTDRSQPPSAECAHSMVQPP